MVTYNNYGYRDVLKEKRKKRKFRVAFLIFSSLIGLVTFILYALFFSGWFLIKEIQVSGYNEISESEIRNSVNSYISKKYLLNYIQPFSNIMLASSETIENFLKEDFPIIEKVDVNKHLFSQNLIVAISEREAIGVWCKFATGGEGESCFYFDKKGVMFKESSKLSSGIFLIIEDGRGRDFKITDSFDDKELFEKVNLTKNILDDLKFIGYSNFFLPQGSFEFWVKTKEGWYIYLDKENDISTQLVALKKFLEEKLLSARRQSLQYIDLRVNNRIYYK